MSFKHTMLGELDRQTAVDLEVSEACGYEALQFKYDGIWCCYEGHTITSRNGLIKESFTCPSWPMYTVLAGEFMYGSQWAQHPSRLGKIYAFDLLALHGKDLRQLPYQERYTALKSLLSTLDNDRLQIVHTYNASGNVERVLNSLHKNKAYEGIVVRNWNQPYNSVIGRIKLDISDDFVVMNVNEGTKANVGKMGSVTVGQYIGPELVPVMDVGGGWTADQRERFFKHPQDILGLVIEVSGKARFESGAFRHPNFSRFRSDKSPSECKFIQPASGTSE